MTQRAFDFLRGHFFLRLFLSFTAGSLSALAMAPFNAWPVLFFTLSLAYGLFTLSQGKMQTFMTGWVFGFGYFLFGLYWIGNALLVEGNAYAWAWPLAVLGLPFGLAFFFGFAFWLARGAEVQHGILKYFAFVTLWAGAEFLRGHILTGFPWNLFAHSWVQVLPILQITAFSDVYILNWLTLLWAGLPGFLIFSQLSIRDKTLVTLGVLISFAGMWLYGAHRISSSPVQEGQSSAAVRLVQANIAQEDKWKREKLLQNVREHLQLSITPDLRSDTFETRPLFIVWPETALIEWLYDDPFVRAEIVAMLRSYNQPAYLLTGMLRQNSQGGMTNSLVLIDQDGEVLQAYDKHHLVPFGEYIPFQKFIPLEPVVRFSGFTPGPGARVLSTPEGVLFSVAICYESIFSRTIVPADQPRPDFIAIITNDAWYGRSPGPYQHQVQAVFRAVESGLPVVRAANTGVSSLITPHGQVIQRSHLMVPYAAEDNLPSRALISKNVSFILRIFFILLNVFFAFTQIYLSTQKIPYAPVK